MKPAPIPMDVSFRKACLWIVGMLGCAVLVDPLSRSGLARGSTEASLSPEVPSPPEDNVCGVNCLFMLLRSWDIPVTPRAVDTATPRHEFGTSMKELKEAARLLGCDVGTYQCGVGDLGRRFTLPAIALMHSEARAGAASRNYPGHYVLVYAIDPGPDGKVHWYDGTYGFRFRRPKATFEKWWTGYVLTRPQSSRAQRILLWLTPVHIALWLSLFGRLRARPIRVSLPCATGPAEGGQVANGLQSV